jgi:hypothetical protein
MKRPALRHSLPVIAAAVLLTALVGAGVTACGGGSDEASPSPAVSPPASTGGVPIGPEAGTKMAPGLYDREDGSVVAVGTVEYRDLEGGFWAVIGGTEAEGDAGSIVAVITNGDDFAPLFRDNEGLSFEVYGHRAGEASIRMAGPEITARRVVLAAEGGPAE